MVKRKSLIYYDWIIINSSAGKDSQAMLTYLSTLAGNLIVKRRMVVVHCDLGDMEWPGVKELAEEQAAHYKIRFEIVKRSQGDLLTHVEKRGMWPSSTARYCTSDHKRGQVSRLITKLTDESITSGINRKIRILNCMGMRADESPARAKKKSFEVDKRNSNGKRAVFTWLPIHKWSEKMVWALIKKSGVRSHYAYGLGMPRLSCAFCIFAPREALLLAGKHNPELLKRYVEVEKRINHTFRVKLSLAEIQKSLISGDKVGIIKNWVM